MANRAAQQSPRQIKGSAIDVGGDQISFDKVDYNVMRQQLQAEAPAAAEELTAAPGPEETVRAAEEQLLATIDRYFDLVAEVLDESPALQEEGLKRLQEAKEILQRNEGGDKAWTLSRAQFEVRRVHVAIAKEQQVQRNEATLRIVVPGIVLVYVLAVIALIGLGGRVWDITTDIPIIGVPLSVVIWAIIGSVAAILYRFYTRDRSNTATSEIRWLIARPIIGIIMGSLSYLAILSGLFVFGAASSAGGDPVVARPQLFHVVAFLGGFSDKFYEAIISAVVGRFETPARPAAPPTPEPQPPAPEQ